MNDAEPINPLIAALGRRERLSDASVEALRNLTVRVRDFQANQDLVQAGSRPTESCVVISGFAARSQYLPNGGRQLDAVHMPGDFVDLHSLHLQEMDHSVTALGRCIAGFIPHNDLLVAMQSHPQLTWLFWQITVTDAAIARTWITCLGRRSAEQNMAHLVCELLVRLRAVGQVQDGVFQFPATQNDLADMLGLSTVHVNRTLQDLRAQRLLEWESQHVRVLDFDRLTEKAEFDPMYLAPGRPTPMMAPQFRATEGTSGASGA